MKNEKFLGYHVSYETAPEDVLGEMRWVTTFVEDIDQAKRMAEGAVEHATEETKFVYVYGVTENEHGNIDYYEATKIRARYDEEEEEEEEEEKHMDCIIFVRKGIRVIEVEDFGDGCQETGVNAIFCPTASDIDFSEIRRRANEAPDLYYEKPSYVYVYGVTKDGKGYCKKEDFMVRYKEEED